MNSVSPSPVASACAGTAPAGAASLLRMAVGTEVLAVSIDAVREILEVGRLTPLPRTPDFVRGVMNLRGSVVPVVDLSARLGLGVTAVGRRTCIVVVDVHDNASRDEADDDTFNASLVVGLMVDAVFEVFDVAADSIEAVPALGTVIAGDYLNGMARAHGKVVGVLAIDRTLSLADLAAAIAAHRPN